LSNLHRPEGISATSEFNFQVPVIDNHQRVPANY
jgi:hypothetical protein